MSSPAISRSGFVPTGGAAVAPLPPAVPRLAPPRARP